ncbi:MAG: DNA-3-methyladenine glycosylase 2 family protein [Alphaproteobacteria bacterium]|nr:MAG: DNA-3-methyladenine glycosylase 2 family protein [Alphaproteobacteria bacterium]
MGEIVRPVYWQEACAHLTRRDKVMGELIAAYPTGMLGTRGEALVTLVRSVVGQQISVKAAASIWARFEAVLDGRVTAEGILALSDEQMRGCGFSGSKVRYVRGIAQGFADGTVHPGLWDGMSDEAVIGELVKLPGIGRWTAEMFLMFFLMRPDVLALDDLALINGFKRAYGATFKDKDEVPLKVWKQRMAEAGAKWVPYRTVACWYLWRSLDPEEVAY